MARFAIAFAGTVTAVATIFANQSLGGTQHPISSVALRGGQIHFAETRVNTFTASAQDHAAIALCPNGDTVVVWDSRRQQGGTYGIYMQRFQGNGSRIGGETQVNLHTDNMQINPAVAVDRMGNVWIAWESYEQDGSGAAIIARRFTADGFVGSHEWLINDVVEGHQSDVVVACDGKGHATFAWTTPAIGEQPRRVVYRRFERDGTPLCREMPVSPTECHQSKPAIAAAPDGTCYLTWAETDSSQVPIAIQVARMADGRFTPLPQATILSESARTVIEPAIAATDSGFALGWLRSNHDDFEVLMTQCDTTGVPLHEPVIASPIGAQRVSGVAVVCATSELATPGVTVAWNRALDGVVGDQTIIEARSFRVNGEATGLPIQINQDGQRTHGLTAASGKQRMVADKEGDIVIVWNGNCLNDASAIGVTRIAEKHPIAFAPPPTIQATGIATATAKPHEPPIFNRRTISREELGGDRDPRSRNAEFGFVGITNTGWRPPDPTLAVGPDHIVTTTNGGIAWFTKSGTLQFLTTISGAGGFWGDQGATSFVFDPEVLFDPQSQRFFAMACERGSDAAKSVFLLAVSDDADPNGTWFKYRLDVTGIINDDDIDSPNMAIDSVAVYLSADFFGPDKYLIYMLDKTQVMAGATSPSATHLILTGQQSHGLAMNYDPLSLATYLIRGDEFTSSTTLHLSAIVDPLGTPTITNVDLGVPLYGHPIDPVSMGTSTRPELFESRFWSCVYRNGSLWAVHHQSPNSSTDVARVRWYEIAMNEWPLSGQIPQLVQGGDILPGSSTYTFFPSIWVDDDGNAAITFAKSSSSEFISMCRAVRLFDDPPNTFRPLETVKESAEAYSLNRWGDYSGTMDDPIDPNTFWGVHEYNPGSNSWNTWIGKYDLPVAHVAAEGSKLLDGEIVGGLVDLLEFADDQVLELDPVPTINPTKQKVDLILQATSPSLAPDRLGVWLNATMLGGPAGDVMQTVRLFNLRTNSWEVIDSRSAAITDERILIDVSGDTARFINQLNGEITLSAVWTSDAFSGPPFDWTIDLDQLVWRIVP